MGSWLHMSPYSVSYDMHSMSWHGRVWLGGSEYASQPARTRCCCAVVWCGVAGKGEGEGREGRNLKRAERGEGSGGEFHVDCFPLKWVVSDGMDFDVEPWKEREEEREDELNCVGM